MPWRSARAALYLLSAWLLACAIGLGFLFWRHWRRCERVWLDQGQEARWVRGSLRQDVVWLRLDYSGRKEARRSIVCTSPTALRFLRRLLITNGRWDANAQPNGRHTFIGEMALRNGALMRFAVSLARQGNVFYVTVVGADDGVLLCPFARLQACPVAFRTIVGVMRDPHAAGFHLVGPNTFPSR